MSHHRCCCDQTECDAAGATEPTCTECSQGCIGWRLPSGNGAIKSVLNVQINLDISSPYLAETFTVAKTINSPMHEHVVVPTQCLWTATRPPDSLGQFFWLKTSQWLACSVQLAVSFNSSSYNVNCITTGTAPELCAQMGTIGQQAGVDSHHVTLDFTWGGIAGHRLQSGQGVGHGSGASNRYNHTGAKYHGGSQTISGSVPVLPGPCPTATSLLLEFDGFEVGNHATDADSKLVFDGAIQVDHSWGCIKDCSGGAMPLRSDRPSPSLRELLR